jgi:hypothetical protein
MPATTSGVGQNCPARTAFNSSDIGNASNGVGRQTQHMQIESDQFEFAQVPRQTGPAPVETVNELQRIIEGLLMRQTGQQRVVTCQNLISSAYAGHSLYVAEDPLRIEICEKAKAARGRKVMTKGDTIIRTVLVALTLTRDNIQVA